MDGITFNMCNTVLSPMDCYKSSEPKKCLNINMKECLEIKIICNNLLIKGLSKWSRSVHWDVRKRQDQCWLELSSEKIWLSRREVRIEFQKGAVAWSEAFICFGHMPSSSDCPQIVLTSQSFSFICLTFQTDTTFWSIFSYLDLFWIFTQGLVHLSPAHRHLLSGKIAIIC